MRSEGEGSLGGWKRREGEELQTKVIVSSIFSVARQSVWTFHAGAGEVSVTIEGHLPGGGPRRRRSLTNANRGQPAPGRGPGPPIQPTGPLAVSGRPVEGEWVCLLQPRPRPSLYRSDARPGSPPRATREGGRGRGGERACVRGRRGWGGGGARSGGRRAPRVGVRVRRGE